VRVAEPLHQIGEVADRVGLSLRTVRYYEEMGLLVPEKRTEGGFRMYSEDQVDRLRLIKQMKPLGFTVQEMRALLEARDTLRDGDASAKALDHAHGVLLGFAAAASARCQQLRDQLAAAEAFSEQVRRESRRTARGGSPTTKP